MAASGEVEDTKGTDNHAEVQINGCLLDKKAIDDHAFCQVGHRSVSLLLRRNGAPSKYASEQINLR